MVVQIFQNGQINVLQDVTDIGEVKHLTALVKVGKSRPHEVLACVAMWVRGQIGRILVGLRVVKVLLRCDLLRLGVPAESSNG